MVEYLGLVSAMLDEAEFSIKADGLGVAGLRASHQHQTARASFLRGADDERHYQRGAATALAIIGDTRGKERVQSVLQVNPLRRITLFVVIGNRIIEDEVANYQRFIFGKQEEALGRIMRERAQEAGVALIQRMRPKAPPRFGRQACKKAAQALAVR